MSFRTIAKFGFILVVIGFFMPMACNLNGFQMVGSSGVSGALKFALIGLFLSAIIGFLIGLFLLLKKKVPVALDWVVMIAVFCFGLIPFFYYIKRIRNYQTGVYVMLLGAVIVIIFQIMSLRKKER